MKHSFKKSERLKSKIAISKVYSHGLILKKYPIMAKYLPISFDDQSNLKVLISVPKKRIAKATDRNKIRRQIKEAFRVQKHLVKNELTAHQKSLALFFIYTGKEKPEYAIIEEKIKLILKDLQQNISREGVQA